MKGDEEEDGGKRVKDARHFENEFIKIKEFKFASSIIHCWISECL